MTKLLKIQRSPIRPAAKQVKGAMKRFRLILPLAAAFTLAAMGCGGSFIGGSSTTTLVGTWTLDSMTINGTTTTCPNSVTVTGSTTIACSRYTDKFNSDGTILRTSADGVTKTSGKYSYNGSVLTTAFGTEDHQVPITIASTSTTYTTTQNLFGYSVTYSFIKS